MSPMPEATLFEAVGGAAGVLRLAGAWHERVMADEIVAHAFSHGFHPRHTERLAAYWGEAWGGPPVYSEQYGTESSVVRMHSGNGPHEEMDARAIECFDRAMDDVGLAEPLLRQVLHDYFAWATTTTMAAYPDDPDLVPQDLRIPHWSWAGLKA
jgi:hemoglobin